MRYQLIIFLFLVSVGTQAQIGTYRNDLSIGVNAGYVLSNVGFSPRVPQSMHHGFTGGLSLKYVCEKYFNTYCSVVAELNYASIGWKENILTNTDQPVINSVTNLPEEYCRTIGYLQLPVFAHLAWGKENDGFQFFFRAGPQFGLYLHEKTETNFDIATRNESDRSNNTVAQDTMSIANKFDYGIAAGIGMEYGKTKIGRFQIEARYYYGLGNIFGDSKKDYFGKSNFGNIIVKISYLFDLRRSKTNKNNSNY